MRRLVDSVPAVDLASPPWRRRAREAFQSDRLLTWTAICAAGYVAAFLAGTLVFAEGTRPAVALTDLVYPVPEAIAAALLYVAGRRSRRAPWFWYLASLSMLCGLAGDVNWAVYDLLLGAPPTPSVGDILYMAQPVLLVGALIASYPVVRPRPGDVADLAIPFTAVLFGVLELVIEPQVAGGLTAATLPSVAETLITIVAALVFTSIVAGHRGLPASVRLLYAGVLAAAVSYPVYAYAISLSGWQHTNWIYTGFEVMFVLSGLAGLVRIRRGEPSRTPTHVANDVNVWMITAGLALVLAVTGLTMREGRMDAEAPWVALGAITVVLVRMHQIVRQRGRLAVELRRSADQLARSLSAQQRLATTDSLTKIANRRAFDERLRAAIDAAGEPGGSVGLLVLDLDHFKLVNDRYGHPTGDQVLQSVARRIRRVTRTQDTLARIGGEEFAVVVPAAAAGELVELADRCRLAVASHPFTVAGRRISITTSIGTAHYPTDAQTREVLVQAADRALYEAKREGRNRVHAGGDWECHEPLATLEMSALAFLERLADQLADEHHAGARSRAMRELTAELCDRLAVTPEQRRRCLSAARLSGIVRVGLPAGPLTEIDGALLRDHARIGVDLLRRCDETADVAGIVADLDERPDGRGHPAGKTAGEISPEAKIVAVADAWTAMLDDRPGLGLSTQPARDRLLAGRGSRFDERVVDALLEVIDAETRKRRVA